MTMKHRGYLSIPLVIIFLLSILGAAALNRSLRAASLQDSQGGFRNISVPGIIGHLVVSLTSIFTPSDAQVIDAAGDAILANATIVVVNPDDDYTLTSTPTIADGTTGQIVIITAANDETKTVTLQDQDTLASSNLQLRASTRSVTAKTNISLLL